MRGYIRDAETKRPIPNAAIRVQGARVKTRSAADGSFVLPPLVPRMHIVLVEAEGYAPVAVKIELVDEGYRPTIFLKRGKEKVFEQEDVEVEAAVIEAPRQVEHVLTMKELKQVPGSFNDAVRVVQNLPGVARSPIGLLIVRGTEPQDTGYYIDGIRVPIIFHFLGLHTVVNTDILDKITFLPGNYGVRYGRTVGGVVDIGITEDVPFRLGGYLGLDLLNAQAFLRVPINDRSGLLLSVRRGYIDFMLQKGLSFYEDRRGEDVNVGFYQAPKYWDYQVLYNLKLSSRDFLHVMAFGASDTFRIVAEPPASIPPDYRGDGEAGADNSFHKVMARWRHTTDALISQLTVSFGPDQQRYSFGAFDVIGENLGLVVREDTRIKLEAFPRLTLRAGIDAFVGSYSVDLALPTGPDTDFDDPFAQSVPYNVEVTGYYLTPATYLEAEYDVTHRVKVIPGIRADPVIFPGQYSTFWVDPRLDVRWRPWKHTTLKTNVGRFGDIPPPFAIDEAFGATTDLVAPYSIQYALGFEQAFTPLISLELTGFLSDLQRQVVYTDDGVDPTGPHGFSNSGRGVNRGIEVLFRHNPDGRFFGWISYTLLKAERIDTSENLTWSTAFERTFTRSDDSRWYPFDFDQTHILTVVASYDLPREWKLGMRFRYSTGLPYTPLYPGYNDIDENSYVPFIYPDSTNSARLPGFHDLTLRVDKNFVIKKVIINGYLEVINVYNACNPEMVTYNYNYKETANVCGLPIFPNLGFRVEY